MESENLPIESNKDEVSRKKELEGVLKPKSRSGSPYLDRVRESIVEAYTAEYIKTKIGELCEANDLKMTRAGETFEAPNWRAREGGLKMIMQIQGIDSLEDGKQERAAPTNIIVNVVTSPEAKPVIEIKSEEIKEGE